MGLRLLYSKDKSGFNGAFYHFFAACCLLMLLSGSSCTGEQMQQRSAPLTAESRLDNIPMVDGQVMPPENFKSLQIYRERNKTSVPAIRLGSREYVTLRFDELRENPRMFRVRVRHRDADWSASNIMQNFYLSGYREDIISGGESSSVQEPHYTHYHYRFPNENMQVTMSGNYLLEVLEYETSRRLFSVPFFVYEDTGRLIFDYEELYGMDARYLMHHQPFARYHYPSDVISPTTDLRIFFIQNRMWGRARETDEDDMSESGVYRSYLSRPESFVGVYEFRPLNLRRYDAPGPEIVEIRPETIPPRVTLFRDVVNLDVNPRRRNPSKHGLPRDDHRARYVDVRFELELPSREATDLPIYIYGPFNNWTINEHNRMVYDNSTDSYRGSAIIKEGEYDYKYAVVEDGTIADMRLDASFASGSQEYITFVYFWDPEWQSDRLMQYRIDRTR